MILLKKNNIFNKRKYQGFPRIENHCKSHDVSKLDISSLINFSWDDFNIMPVPEILYLILKLLLESDIDLIRGDIICNELIIFKSNNYDGICIFDGSEIIPLYNDIDNNGLPSEFTILNNNVNIYYWESKYNEVGQCIIRGISYESFVWLDLTEDIKSQLISNINYNGRDDLDCKKYDFYIDCIIFCTKFYINNECYNIISDINNEYYNVYGINFGKSYRDIFLEVLSKKSKIALYLTDVDGILGFAQEIENILFLDLDFNIKSEF